MKNIYLLFALFFPFILNAQELTSENHDPIAIGILDHMADVIGDLGSCSFTLSTASDFIDPDHGYVKHYSKDDVFFDGSDKLMVQIDGTKGKKGFWYNGYELDYYSYDENNYVSIPAPNSTIAMIDSVHQTFGIRFPAADFFYPSLTDDIIEGFESVKFLGKNTIDNVECLFIKASNKEMDVLLWIANDAYKLPKRQLILYKNMNNEQYEATFSNWVLNPNIPEALFNFVPPASASQIEILAKN